MNRRRFLSFLGLAPVAFAALGRTLQGGIWRPAGQGHVRHRAGGRYR
ncbi:queuine tRNA-ribosyltransferase, partial [Brucella melitensis UK22/04]